MLADGSAEFTKAMGLELDLSRNGMGVRSQRYSMLVDNGVVKALQRRAAGPVRRLQRRGDDQRALVNPPVPARGAGGRLA